MMRYNFMMWLIGSPVMVIDVKDPKNGTNGVILGYLVGSSKGWSCSGGGFLFLEGQFR